MLAISNHPGYTSQGSSLQEYRFNNGLRLDRRRPFAVLGRINNDHPHSPVEQTEHHAVVNPASVKRGL